MGSGKEGENTDEDEALAAALAAVDGVDQGDAFAAATDLGGRSGGGQEDVMVMSDNDEEVGLVDLEGDWGLESYESWL